MRSLCKDTPNVWPRSDILKDNNPEILRKHIKTYEFQKFLIKLLDFFLHWWKKREILKHYYREMFRRCCPFCNSVYKHLVLTVCLNTNVCLCSHMQLPLLAYPTNLLACILSHIHLCSCSHSSARLSSLVSRCFSNHVMQTVLECNETIPLAYWKQIQEEQFIPEQQHPYYNNQ